MKAVGIIGCGALGRQILDLLLDGSTPDRISYFDDGLYASRAECSFPFDSYLDRRFVDHDFYVGLGYHHLPRKAQILDELISAGRSTPAFVHPSCYVSPRCQIAEGCLVYPLCNLAQEARLAPGVLLQGSVIVSHNADIGTAAYLSPGVILSGNVTVGAAAFLGSGTLVANNRRIGKGAKVAIGTVVTSDVEDDASVIGNPMRRLSRQLKLD